MQQWNWIKFNPNGTIEVDVSDDPETPRWLHIGRAKVRHLRDYGLAVEDADDLVSVREEQIRFEAGYTDDVKDLMIKVSNGVGIEALDSAEMLLAADGATIQRKYTSLLNRFLIGEENPYPALWLKLLNDADMVSPTLGDFEAGNLPTYCFGQETIQAIVNHWQNIPLLLGAAPESSTADGRPTPNRATRRSAARTS